MKRLVIAATLCLMATGAYAQKASVKTAEKLLSSNVAEARNLINAAREHEETKNDPYTWHVAGMAEQTVFAQEFQKIQLGQAANEPAMFDALVAEVPLFLKVYALESTPDAKGKVKLKYAKKAKDILRADFRYLINAGYHYIQSQDYKRSADAFTMFLDVLHHPLLADDKSLRTPEIDTMAFDAAYLSVAASYEGKDYDKAIEQANKYKDQEYKRNEIWQMLTASYLAKTDTVAALPILEEGAKIFPKEMYYLGNIVNIYAKQGKTDEAISFLEKGVAQDPNNVNFISALAGLFETKGDFAKAEELYLRAYELDKEGFDTNYNLGRTYFNHGVATRDVENLDKLTQEKAIELFRKAIPYLEVAYKLQPSEVYYMLASSHAQVGNEAKYNEIRKAHQ